MSTAHGYPRIVEEGDSSFVVEFDERFDEMVNARAIATAATIRERALDGVRDVVPALRSVAVYFDPLRTPREQLMAELRDAAAAPPSLEASGKTVRVPVCYGGEFGADLAAVASTRGLSIEDAIAVHAGTPYRVFMLGFVPGFAYMGRLDPRLATPRHATPRASVPAGSVAIAGEQTGIYPMATPGGWQLIGRTPLRMFDVSRGQPALLAPGDRVEFFPIEPAQWDRFVS